MAAILEEGGFDVAVFDSLSEWTPGVGGSAIVAQTDDELIEKTIQLHGINHPHIPLVAVVREPGPALVAHLYRIGAAGVLDENDEVSVFPNALEAVLEGRTMLTLTVARSMAEYVPRHYDTARWISNDEADWLRAMAAGRTVSEIAEDAGFSERAMFRLLRRLYTRIGVANRTEALVWATRNGVLSQG